MILIDDGIMERIVDAFNEANDIVGFVNTARLSDSDIVESDLEGNKKSYSYRNFLLTLDDLINDYDYEELKDAFFEIVHKYAWKEIIVSIKSAYQALFPLLQFFSSKRTLIFNGLFAIKGIDVSCVANTAYFVISDV